LSGAPAGGRVGGVGKLIRLRRDPVIEARAVPRIVLPRPSSLEVSELAWLAEGVSRQSALAIPAVTACMKLIVGTATQLGVYRYRGAERLEPGPLITRPDPSTTWHATLAGTVDDLVFNGRAYWLVLARDTEGYPVQARWIPFDDVSPDTAASGGAYSELRGYRIAGVRELVPPGDVIRFDAPFPGVLQTGGRTLAAAAERADAARRLSAVELPAGVLKNEGTELNETEADELVARFSANRRKYGIAFVQGVSYSREALNANDLALVEGLANDATEIARLFNVPVAMIAASPSGSASAMLYSNLPQQKALLVSSAIQPYLVAVESTLSAVAYPRGTSVAFDVQTFLRADPEAAAAYAIALWTAELVTREEARSFLGIPTLPTDPTTLAPGKV